MLNPGKDVEDQEECLEPERTEWILTIGKDAQSWEGPGWTLSTQQEAPLRGCLCYPQDGAGTTSLAGLPLPWMMMSTGTSNLCLQFPLHEAALPGSCPALEGDGEHEGVWVHRGTIWGSAPAAPQP